MHYLWLHCWSMQTSWWNSSYEVCALISTASIPNIRKPFLWLSTPMWSCFAMLSPTQAKAEGEKPVWVLAYWGHMPHWTSQYIQKLSKTGLSVKAALLTYSHTQMVTLVLCILCGRSWNQWMVTFQRVNKQLRKQKQRFPFLILKLWRPLLLQSLKKSLY